MRATPVIAGSLAGFVLLAVCIATLWLLRKRKRRLQKERAIRMSEFLQDSDRSSRRSLPPTTPTPSDPDKHRPSSPRLDSPTRHHHPHRRTPTPSSSPISSPSPHHRSIQLTHRAESEDNSHNNNNRLRQEGTSNSDVIFAHQDANVERSLDGDSAGVLIPSIVISSNVNHSRESFTRTGDWTDTRILLPPDTRPLSRRTESLSIPSLAPQSSTLLYPTFDSSSSTSSTSFSSPLLSSQSSSPTIPSSFIQAPSSSSPILPSASPSSPVEKKNLLQSQNHERSGLEVGLEMEGTVIVGPSLRRNDERGGGEEDAPPAYEKCVDE